MIYPALINRLSLRAFITGLALALALTAIVGLAAAQGGEKTHTVQAGETLDSIAELYGISQQTLMEANDITDPGAISAGMELIIPEEEPSPPAIEATPPPEVITGENTYVVQPGDVLDSIAQAYDVAVESIGYANELEPSYPLMPGQVLFIPADAPPYGVVPPAPAAGAAEGQGGGGLAGDQTYVVQPGDVLDSIAQAYDVAVESIGYANELEPPYPLMPGQVLFIPADAPPYGVVPPAPAAGAAEGQGGGGLAGDQTYVVQPGDVLDSIAQAYDVAVESIGYANELEPPYPLMPGQVLFIPADAPPYGVVPPLPGQPTFSTGPSSATGGAVESSPGGADMPPDGQGGGGDVYVVQPGDTVMDIVNTLDIELVDLLRANPQLIDAVELAPGTEIVIP